MGAIVAPLLVVALLGAGALAQTAPECSQAQTGDPSMIDSINRRAFLAVQAKQAEIDARVAAAIGGMRDNGNILTSDVALADESGQTCFAGVPRVCVPRVCGFLGCVGGQCTPAYCATTLSYGYSGTLNSASIQNNEIDVTVDDVTVCDANITAAGFGATINGHVTFRVAPITATATLTAYARAVLEASASVTATGTFTLQPVRVGFSARATMDYNTPERACTLHEFHSLDVNWPAPTLTSFGISQSSFWNWVPDTMLDMYTFIMGDIGPDLQTAVTSAWNNGVETRLEDTVAGIVAAAEDGTTITCPACGTGLTGNPIGGCREVNACHDNACAATQTCTDRRAPSPNTPDGRICAACPSGSRPTNAASTCSPCLAGTAGRGGACAACDPAANHFTSSPGRSSCQTMPVCPPGTHASTTGTASQARVCTANLPGTYTAAPNAPSATPWQTCPAGSRQTTAPTLARDRGCTPCPANQYQPAAGHADRTCMALTECQPGERVVVPPRADRTVDRECSPCPTGYFSNVSNSNTCYRHTPCPPEQHIENNASLIRDYICGDHTDCIPGQHVTVNASQHQPRQCSPCTGGQFTDAVNEYHCRDQRVCPAGESVQTRALPAVARTCAPCLAGEFAPAENSAACVAWTPCQPGEYDMSYAGPTSRNDRDCQPCSPGQYALGTNLSAPVDPDRRRDRRQDEESVWVCANECSQAVGVASTAAVSCSRLVIDECSIVDFAAVNVAEYLVTPSGAFYWKAVRDGGSGYRLNLFPDSRCIAAGGVDSAIVPVVPAAGLTDISAVQAVMTSANYCQAGSAAGCTQINMGFTLAADQLGSCQSLAFHFNPPLLGYFLQAPPLNAVVVRMEFVADCREVAGDPSSCPAETTTSTSTAAATTAPPPTAWPGCMPGEFQCATGNQCFPAAQRCDGALHCTDNSDEAGCAVVTLPVVTTTTPSPTVDPRTFAPTTSPSTFRPNTDTCATWSTCRPGEYVATTATAAVNRECGACVLGEGYTDVANQDECSIPTVCMPGETMVSDTTTRSDRGCANCTDGFFTAGNNAIETPWRTCGPGRYILSHGSASEDRQCGECVLGSGFSAFENQNACTQVNGCPGGVAVGDATLTTDRECADCTAGTYKDPDLPAGDVCISWRDCAMGHYIAANGSTVADRDCALCPVGKFAGAANSIACADPTPCQAGTYRARNATASQDARCSPCVLGSFSVAEDADACTPWTVCNYSLGLVSRDGANATHDNDCVVQVIDNWTDNSAGGSSSENNLTSGGGLAGLVVGIVVFVVLAAVLIMWLYRRQHGYQSDDQSNRPGIANPMYDVPDTDTDTGAAAPAAGQNWLYTDAAPVPVPDAGTYASAGYQDVPGSDGVYDSPMNDSSVEQFGGFGDAPAGLSFTQGYTDVAPVPLDGGGGAVGYIDVDSVMSVVNDAGEIEL